MPTAPLSDTSFETQRRLGQLLCQCAGARRRDPLCPQQCARCARRIDRRYDEEITA